MTTGPRPSCSDAFGKRTGVRVGVTRKPYPTPKRALVLAAMVPLPAVPFAGLVLGSIARRKIRDDASLLGIKQAKAATRLGLAATFLQAAAVGLVVFTMWMSIEQAKTTIIDGVATVDAEGRPVDLRAARATPDFGFFSFRPGAEQTYTLAHPGGTETVRVRFDEGPAFTAWGPIFRAQIVKPQATASAQ